MALKLEDKPLSVQVVSNRGQQLTYAKRHDDTQNRRIELNEFTQDANSADIAKTQDQLSDAVDVLNDLTFDLQATDGQLQDTIGDLQEVQDWQTDTIGDLGVITSTLGDQADAQSVFSGLLADTIIDLANAIDDISETQTDMLVAQADLKRIGAYGLSTVTPDGSGLATISYSDSFPVGEHGSLTYSLAVPSGSTFFHVQIVSVSTLSFVVKLFDASGAALTTGSYAVRWIIRPQALA